MCLVGEFLQYVRYLFNPVRQVNNWHKTFNLQVNIQNVIMTVTEDYHDKIQKYLIPFKRIFITGQALSDMCLQSRNPLHN